MIGVSERRRIRPSDPRRPAVVEHDLPQSSSDGRATLLFGPGVLSQAIRFAAVGVVSTLA